jgi:hypothetical protein
MKEVDVEEYLKHEVTDEQAKADAEFLDKLWKQIDEDNRLYPIDEDFEEFQRKYKCLPV